jgi:hypothetical protein
MRAPKTLVIGLCTACALIVSVCAASTADATTFYACVFDAGTGEYLTDTCDPGATGNNFRLVPPLFTSTPITAEAIGKTILKATTGGVAFTVTATSLEGSGELENTAKEEVSGTETLTLKGVTANHGCSVTGSSAGVVTTSKLRIQTKSASELKIEPNSGSELLHFTVSGCEAGFSAFNHTWTYTGSLAGTAIGGMVDFQHNHSTTTGTLFTEGTIPAGLELELVHKSKSTGDKLVIQ